VAPQQAIGRRVTIDLFFRTLAQAYGQRAVCVVFSGADSDGAIGLKHIRAQGGVTIAQDPEEAEHDSMPMTAISTGMVDWVLPVSAIPGKLMEFVANENRMKLPPEILEAEEPDLKANDAPGGETVSDETRATEDESALSEALSHVRAQTGHDFSHYKRATVLRRVARRLQVNSIETIPEYLDFLRGHPAEARALLQDLLIGVTHFFRDQAAFSALEAHIPQLFAGRRTQDQIRIWVAGCASGEEAYSIAMLLCEHAERLEHPPSIQIFASDVDDHSIQEARDGLYPATIEADVSLERLRHFFRKDHGRYRVRKELREKVLFASHNLLRDPPFSRVDFVSCRNLLIYLTPKAQEQVFDTFHFALRPGGLLFIGGSETGGNAQSLFSCVDARHRLYVRRSVARPTWRIPMLPERALEPRNIRLPGARPRALPPLTRGDVEEAEENTPKAVYAGQERRGLLFGELHLKLLEQYGPPSIVVNAAHDIVHLSEKAGRYLQFVAGEPSANLIKVVDPALRIELRTALFRAAQEQQTITTAPQTVQIGATHELISLQVRPMPSNDPEKGFFLILFETASRSSTQPAEPGRHEAVNRELDGEIDFLREQLSATVEQYEAANEELKAANEELQATNEEMRSATEELETSKEELQSVNEELVTVNHELKSSVEELSRTNADLTNLMASTDIGTIFLDRQLRIQRFTPSAQRIFNLIPADLDRPLSDITHKLAYADLITDAEKVMDDLATIEREVSVGPENWYLVRIAPYRTAADRIAGVVATFIDISQLKRSDMELRGVSKELANQVQRFDTIMGAVPDFVYEFDLEGRFTYVSQSLLDLWGKTSEDAIGKNFHELDYTRELATKLQRQIREVIDTQHQVKDETPYTSALGSRMYEYLFFPLLDDNSTVEGVGGVTRDITERKQAEEALRGSEERYRTLFDLVPVAVYSTDAEGVIEEFNRRAVELWGRTPRRKTEKFCGSFKMYYSDGRPMPHDECPMARVLRGEELDAAELEVLVEQVNGDRRSVAVAPRALRDEEGIILGAINCVHDITDRKQAEQAVRESEQRFRTVADNVPQLIWTNEPRGKANYFNSRWFEYTGLSYEESAGPGWQAIVHPEDGPAAVSRWQKALAAGKVFDAEYRLRRHDGSYRWHIGRNVPLRENGDVAGWFGSATDIEDFKSAEAALHESDERFRLLVEGARDYAMFLLDVENRITFWSKGAERVFGWSEREAMEQKGDLIFTPEDQRRGAVEEEIDNAIKEGRALDRRYHLRKDGSHFWADGILMRLDDEQGKLRGFAKVARDATDQRRIEDELRHARDEMEQRVIERTRDVLATNAELESAMAQRQQLEKELLEISEREKRRIGDDLHDMVCQELTATALFLKSSAKKVESESSAAAEMLNESALIVNRNVGVTRDLARGFQPVMIAEGGLMTAMRTLCSQVNARPNISCDLNLPRPIRVNDETLALNLYRIAQEAVGNAVKHSGASKITMCMEREGNDVRLVVEDNGKGLRIPKRSKGLGLHLMKYRANVLGGTFAIEQGAEGGARIVCTLPAKLKPKTRAISSSSGRFKRR
ncbi:MAG: signal transduction histidine kinase with CheB and CheR, partial [Spartobacteria bacterium]|nr:signal transduction histidine kinase with CheB and CheR [Spartobacteria bacterium]